MTSLDRRSTPPLAAWVIAGAAGWLGMLWIGVSLWLQTPPRAGFDLRLLLDAARSVLVGRSPYDPALLAGNAPDATSLFYSYPPPVAQALTLLTGIPDGVALLLWGGGAVAGLALVAAGLARSPGAATWSRVVLGVIALAPLVFPFAIALLFGNLDVWYPLAYGAVLLAALPGASRRTLAAAGVAVAIVTIAKLHPITLVAWMLARSWAERRGSSAWLSVTVIAATGLAIVAASLAFGGTGPWIDYLAVVRTGAGANLVDARNIGPVSLLGQTTGMAGGGLVAAQIVVALGALAASVIAGLRIRDNLLSVAVASAASLVVLPVTWYHYPVALIPVGIALALRQPASRPWILVAVVVADAAIAAPPLLWLAVALLLAQAALAARTSRAAP